MSARGINPQLVTIHDSLRAYSGYTLYASRGTTDIWLINMDGQFTHHWQVADLSGNVRLLPNGNLLTDNMKPNTPIAGIPASGGELLELDWDGNVVWRHEDPYLNLHEYDCLENGNLLISRWIPIPDDIVAKVKGGQPGTEREGVMWSDCFQEITRDGKVEWEWKAYEHMDFDIDVLCPLCRRTSWTYVNALTALPDGNVLASLRLINTIAIIERSSGNITWRWGQGEIAHQHNPTMLDNGNILLFDNGLHRLALDNSAASYSRVLEVNPKTNKIEWEYKDREAMSFYSSICAGAQRLPNGNTLICEATKGRIFEVTHDKEIVWEFVNPFHSVYRPEVFGMTNMVYRAVRYGQDYPGLKGRSLDPDRFKWVLQEKGKPITMETPTLDKEKAVQERLARLGY